MASKRRCDDDGEEKRGDEGRGKRGRLDPRDRPYHDRAVDAISKVIERSNSEHPDASPEEKRALAKIAVAKFLDEERARLRRWEALFVEHYGNHGVKVPDDAI